MCSYGCYIAGHRTIVYIHLWRGDHRHSAIVLAHRVSEVAASEGLLLHLHGEVVNAAFFQHCANSLCNLLLAARGRHLDMDGAHHRTGG